MPESEGTDTARGLSSPQLTELIEKEYVGLRLLLTRRTGDYQLACELLHDAVCIAWEKWRASQIRHPEQLAGYIFQVAMNLLHNKRRLVGDRPERRATLDQLDREGVGVPSSDVTDEEKIAAKLKDLIRAMKSQRDREVLIRFYLNEEDKELICRDLQLDARQFDRILHRARQRLGQLLMLEGLSLSDFVSAS
jgi:DNA-directed RNA polymerase specialized sigma24 family protein